MLRGKDALCPDKAIRDITEQLGGYNPNIDYRECLLCDKWFLAKDGVARIYPVGGQHCCVISTSKCYCSEDCASWEVSGYTPWQPYRKDCKLLPFYSKMESHCRQG